ncbi:hypothetical protein JCGZ_27041 [Jatropha curcas]|uniref:Uncharacterized protein n=1 Tax=Jatropha curcas TaxID=180498 RepID=A0A067JMG1_JATCU|nr:hypothetical protein JCGZ_27041 [Jatropha curcas]
MASSSYSSDEDFLESLGISLDKIRVIADVDTHASVTGVYAQAPDIYAGYRQGELTATQVARFTLLLLFASTFWSNRKEKFNPSILKSLEDLAHLTEVDFQIRDCRSGPHPPPEDMRAGKQMILIDAHTEGIPHMEFIRSGDYDEFCQMFLMQPIGSRLDNLPRSTPSQPLGTRSSRASGPSAC